MKTATLACALQRAYRRWRKPVFAAVALMGAFAASTAAAESATTISSTASAGQGATDDAASQLLKLQRAVPRAKGPWTPADHSKFKALEGPFKSPREVTSACLTCHTDAAKQVKATIHWTWSKKDPNTGRMIGKANVFNTFCANIKSNEQFCTTCHVGYGDPDPSHFVPFSARADDQVDCLVCHDQSGKYKKIPFLGGNPATERTRVRPGCGEVYGTEEPYVDPPDLAAVAQSVGAPKRENCGGCHFYGGGGDGVKHGDLDSSLVKPTKSLDVHMDAGGLNFACETCHVASDHLLAGSHYDVDAKPEGDAYLRGGQHGGDPATCQSCHGDTPHKKSALSSMINMHARDVACQTCHIPAFARGGVATKMKWDYSTAGKFGPNGTPLVVNNAKNENVYWGVKGAFEWGKDVVPQYAWYNGSEQWMNNGDKLQPGKDGVVEVNRIFGSATDGKSRIWPFKIMRNNQPYDPVNNILTVFHSFGFDDDAFTISGDWNKAIAAGMKAADLPYSGKFSFVPTRMYWPITHMVAPAQDALKCGDCHTDGGRLASVAGIYIPGRSSDHQPWVELLGKLAVALGLFGVVGHGLLRILIWLRGRRSEAH
jgi:octaheme c-type cytochrome (tetrathionate reductase family)